MSEGRFLNGLVLISVRLFDDNILDMKNILAVIM